MFLELMRSGKNQRENVFNREIQEKSGKYIFHKRLR